mmetsp:Transcript_456/g.809  ORF Transcript_456/g.809 Transcript_456/m.809 type:complete len:86 (-) Transcript_456:279-536(-)|eukprot:CAMPEP_0203801640 /NCGR_PEP_ID=MMETSP0100_2-20121128/11471_1 /ASSEMBLY_ACC=CAM_ASM_000210 /TAXON_ID=96639 /ORGANISM=" , Strain NY0313808BC1" /LENGTH=85 /DNA_ID=CAMNT_0050708429 /DNA_START=155 /DNA_END=412 /DNA_ORIENTATION=-
MMVKVETSTEDPAPTLSFVDVGSDVVGAFDVGIFEGCDEGATDGLSEGSEVGLTEGLALGAFEGYAVGVKVGFGVGGSPSHWTPE